MKCWPCTGKSKNIVWTLLQLARYGAAIIFESKSLNNLSAAILLYFD